MAIGGYQFGRYVNMGPRQYPVGSGSKTYQNEIDNSGWEADVDNDCALVMGTTNTTSGAASLIMGTGNVIKSGSTQNMILGGSNTIEENSDQCVIFGLGNVLYSGSDSCAIFGVANNTSVGDDNDRNMVIGLANNVEGNRESLIVGQSHTVVDGHHSIIAGSGNNCNFGVENAWCIGTSNTISGDCSRGAIMGWNNSNTTNADYSLTTGFHGIGNIELGYTRGGGRLNSVEGSIQFTDILVACQTTDATQTTMVTNRSSDKLRVPLNSSMMFRIDVIARRTGTQTESAAYEILGCIKNDAGTTALEGSVTVTTIAEGDAAWDVTAVANNTDDTLEIKVTGKAATNINWVASGRLTETNGA